MTICIGLREKNNMMTTQLPESTQYPTRNFSRPVVVAL